MLVVWPAKESVKVPFWLLATDPMSRFCTSGRNFDPVMSSTWPATTKVMVKVPAAPGLGATVTPPTAAMELSPFKAFAIAPALTLVADGRFAVVCPSKLKVKVLVGKFARFRKSMVSTALTPAIGSP